MMLVVFPWNTLYSFGDDVADLLDLVIGQCWIAGKVDTA